MLPTDEDIIESFKEGLTQSEIMERTNCPRKHMFRYILQLKRQGSFSWALLTGGAVHHLLEEHYKSLQAGEGGLTTAKAIEFDFEPDVVLEPNQYDDYKYWQIVAGMLVYRHNKFYWEQQDSKFKIYHVEVPIDLEYRSFRLRGIIDLVADGLGKPRPWIMDHKTASDISDLKLEGWQFRFQFLFYSWMWTKVTGERPSGNIVNILKKPLERRSVKRGETVEDFCRRIDFNIMANPQEYFRREWIPLDDGTIERFQRYTLDPVLTQFQMLQETMEEGRFNQQEKEAMLLMPNTDHCLVWNTKCEYLNLCKDNFNDYAVEFIKRHIKHPELPTVTGSETSN